MAIITKRRIRCGAKVNQPFAASPLVDFYNNQQIEAVQGNATRFEFGFLTIAGEIYDIADVESLTLLIKTSQTVDTTLAAKTLAAENLDATLDAETWADGSKSHAVFIFSNAEMNLAISGTRQVMWLVVTAILTDGSEVTLAAGGIIFHPDNNNTADPPPENPGTSITLEQADARYPRVTPLALTTVPYPDPCAAVILAGIAIDWKLGRVFARYNIPTASTITFSNSTPGKTILIYLKDDSSSTYAHTWPAGITWESGVPPHDETLYKVTITCTADGVYIGSFDAAGDEFIGWGSGYSTASITGTAATANGQSAFTTHNDESVTEWVAVRDSEEHTAWLPRTAGLTWNTDVGAWKRLTFTSGTLQLADITNQ